MIFDFNMPDVDETALNVLLAEGKSLRVAVVGSLVDEPRPPQARPAKHPRLVLVLAVISAIAAVIAIRAFYRLYCGYSPDRVAAAGS